MNNTQAPLIIGFVSDLLFSSKIDAIAEQMGCRVYWIERSNQIAPDEPDIRQKQLAEHVSGPGLVLLDTITRRHPTLMIFDLSNNAIPWREWLPLLKSAPATRRVPVICYGSHVDAGTLKFARSAGADTVLARSGFLTALPDLILQYTLLPDSAMLTELCSQELSQLAIKGLQQFNRGEYYEAHETLEEAWNDDDTPGRELYRAILQVAVAYLQIERRNYRGAIKMLLRLRQWIDPLPDICRGVDVAQLRRDANKIYATLIQLGPERIDEFDTQLIHQVNYTQPLNG